MLTEPAMNRAKANPTPVAIVGLLLCLFILSWPTTAEGQGEQALVPPQAVIDAGLIKELDTKQKQRAAMTWTQVQASVKPMPWPEVGPQAARGALAPDATDLLKRAKSAMLKGDAFRAVQRLREAEVLEPSHPKVVRALGLAYAKSGNLSRAADYLYRIALNDRGDAEALLLLVRHASQSEPLEQLLAYCIALDKTDAPSSLSDAYRAAALERMGYTKAAADRLSAAIASTEKLNLDAIDKVASLPAQLRRELRVNKALLPQLNVGLGDLYLQSGEYEHAAKTYADVELKDPATRHALGARRVYLAMLTSNQAEAANQVIALLRADDAIAEDAQLAGYLVDQGMAASQLATRIKGLLDGQGVTLPRLVALSKVAEKHLVLGQINVWLNSGPVSPDRLTRGISLVQFDDTDPADAEPLAELLTIIAQRIAKSPEQALLYAKAAVSEIDAPVTLLRAIQGDAFAADQDAYHRLVAAVAYEAAGRRHDALPAYALLLSADGNLADQVMLPVVRLQLALGLGDRAHALLGEPDLKADWPAFELALRAMSAAGDPREALIVIDRYIKANGKQLKSDVLRIEIIAQMGQPQEACNLLLRLISSYPQEPLLYRLGIDLAYDYRAFFSRMTDADRMRRAFLTRLISNLPQSPLARIGMAQNIMSNPSRRGEAENILLKLLKEDPGNLSALILLVEMYDESGDEALATVMHEQYALAISPGVDRAMVVAERAISVGLMPKAIETIEQIFALDKQGVLPGRAITGNDISSLLRHLEAADPDRDTDELYLAMVRRFPEDAGLNNALGYRWVVQNKNLLQAEAMIRRALKAEPTNHSLLDSLAWVQYKLGQFEKAEKNQLDALEQLKILQVRIRGVETEMGATVAILNDHMGDILYKRGDVPEALKHWRTAMRQDYAEEDMLFDAELRSLQARLIAKVGALAKDQPVPVAEVPGPESHGPKGHPADIEPGGPSLGE